MPCSLPYVCSFSRLLWIYVADWWSTLSHLVSSWGALSHQKCIPWTKPLPKPSNFECPAQSPLTLPSQENVLSTSSVCIGTTLQILPSLVMLGKIAAVLGLIHRSLISSLCFNCYNFLEVIVGNLLHSSRQFWILSTVPCWHCPQYTIASVVAHSRHQPCWFVRSSSRWTSFAWFTHEALSDMRMYEKCALLAYSI